MGFALDDDDDDVRAFADTHRGRFLPGVLAMWLAQGLARIAPERGAQWARRIETWVWGRPVTRELFEPLASQCCDNCPHGRRQHSSNGCTWTNLDGSWACRCFRTYMDLRPRGR